ncbi:MAG: protein-tyrosine-phosphatase [Flavobacteriales bacterium]|nr:protein-tyrosine-phosphatase [Flavobacteriales bacterium]
MASKSSYVNHKLSTFVLDCIKEEKEIDPDRKGLLDNTGKRIVQAIENGGQMNLIFICTHNSRRSHFAQVWAQIAAFHYGLPIHCYSGGTEETAIHRETLEALITCGLSKCVLSESQNPIISFKYSQFAPPIIAFSKQFDHPFNPSLGFGAIMTCDHADEDCPYIPEASFRIPITYKDPKHADNSPVVKQAYMKSCSEIAREMFYMMKFITHV